MTPIVKVWLHARGYRCAGVPSVWFDKDGGRIGYDDKMVEHLISVIIETEMRRDNRQALVGTWAFECFQQEALSLPQRGLRLGEETFEACQVLETPVAKLRDLLDYVYARAPGKLDQEMGGVGVTLLALGAAAGISADAAEEAEVQRVLAKPRSHFTARNQAKNDAGFKVVS